MTKMTGKIFILAILATFILSSSVAFADTWWDSAWKYRTMIVTNEHSGSRLTDYPVQFTLDLSSQISQQKVGPILQDLRFSYYDPSSSREVEIPYWIEGGEYSVYSFTKDGWATNKNGDFQSSIDTPYAQISLETVAYLLWNDDCQCFIHVLRSYFYPGYYIETYSSIPTYGNKLFFDVLSVSDTTACNIWIVKVLVGNSVLWQDDICNIKQPTHVEILNNKYSSETLKFRLERKTGGDRYWEEVRFNGIYVLKEDPSGYRDVKVWAKVPSIPAWGNSIVYMYYGNPSATSKSGTSSVFMPKTESEIYAPYAGQIDGAVTDVATNTNNNLAVVSYVFDGYLEQLILYKGLSSSGSTWNKKWNGPFGPYPASVQIDSQDNIIFLYNQSSKPTIAKYDISGNQLWSKSTNCAFGLSLDPQNNIICSSLSKNLIKYDQYGNLLWNKTISFVAYSTTTNTRGDVIAVGGSDISTYDVSGSLVWSKTMSYTMTSIGTIAINIGAPLKKIYGGVLSDSQNNIYISATPSDLKKLDQNGNELWDSVLTTFEADMAMDPASDQITVVGVIRTDSYNQDWLIAKYLPSGKKIWETSWDGGKWCSNIGRNCGVDVPYAVASGSSIVGGYYSPTYGIRDYKWPTVHEFYDTHYVKPAPTHSVLSVADTWWDSAWKYRTMIVTNEHSGNKLTDYPVQFTLDFSSHITQQRINSALQDLRFSYYDPSSSREVEIPYWIENSSIVSEVKVWAKIPSMPAWGNSIVYMYYGNPSATSKSSASSVFTVKSYDLGFYGSGAILDLATDTNGDVISAMTREGKVEVGKIRIATSGTRRIISTLWSNSYNPTGGTPRVTADSQNNVLFVYGPNLTKLNANGNLLWKKTTDNNNGLAVDSQNNILTVTGTSKLVRYGTDGTKAWEKAIPFVATTVKTDSSDNIIVAADKSVNKYDKNVNLLWSKSLNSSIQGHVGIDSQGNVVVAAYPYLMKLNAVNGNEIWSLKPGWSYAYDECEGFDWRCYTYYRNYFTDLTVDSADHTTLVGYYTTYARYGSWTYYAWFANKYSSNGSSIWGSTYGSQPLQYNYPVDYAYAVTTGSSVVGGSVNNNGYTVGAVNSPYIVEFYDGHYVKPAPTYGFLNIGGSGTIGEQNLRITLKPGQGAFEIQTITINPVIGNYYPIGPLYGYGTKNYLNIIWNATYGNTLVGKISAACYLNCPLTITDISQCISPSIQSCQYTGAAGIGSCTITNPTYDYKNKNTVICSFRNPDNPSMTYKPYPNGTFMPISFSLRLPSVITFPIGTMNRLPFNILNLGLLEDSYNTLVASTNPSFFNSVDNPSSTSRALYNEQASAFPRLQFMSSSIPYTLTVQISSAADPSTCTVASDCSSLVYGSTPACVQGRCNYQVQIPVQATLASLPDFDWTGVVQILILSTVVLLVVSRKIKVFK